MDLTYDHIIAELNDSHEARIDEGELSSSEEAEDIANRIRNRQGKNLHIALTLTV